MTSSLHVCTTHGYLQAKDGKFSSFNTDHMIRKTEYLYHCLFLKKCQLSWLKAKAESMKTWSPLCSSILFFLDHSFCWSLATHSPSWNCFLKCLSNAAVLGPCSYCSMAHDSGHCPNDLTAPISLLHSGHVLSPFLPLPAPFIFHGAHKRMPCSTRELHSL